MAFSERKRIGGRALNEVIVPKKVFFFFLEKRKKSYNLMYYNTLRINEQKILVLEVCKRIQLTNKVTSIQGCSCGQKHDTLSD